jgi:hypothetical protein
MKKKRTLDILVDNDDGFLNEGIYTTNSKTVKRVSFSGSEGSLSNIHDEMRVISDASREENSNTT